MNKIAAILAILFSIQYIQQLNGANVPVFLGGDGRTMETAVIVNLDTEMRGIQAEYMYLAQHFPEYKTKMQALMSGEGGKYYDRMELESADGKTLTIFFDITKFFGH